MTIVIHFTVFTALVVVINYYVNDETKLLIIFNIF